MFKIRHIYFHTSSLYRTSNKSLLSKLRKSTGFSFVNCKEALEKFNQDLHKAESWLKERAQKEGWTKATKLQGRPMSHGLIGIILQNNAASIVEVNCETDFVSRNIKFQNLTSLACSALHCHGLDVSKQRISYGSDEMGKLEMNGKSITDVTALEVGSLGENIAVRRGYFIKTLPNQHISYYIHETGPKIDSALGLCHYGKYGSLVVYSRDEATASVNEEITILSTDQIGRELCQHIVGMNPLCIDRLNETENDTEAKNEHQEEKEDEQVEADEAKKHQEEDRLLKQEFILNPDITVDVYLRQQGATILDFLRLECGEDLLQEKTPVDKISLQL